MSQKFEADLSIVAQSDIQIQIDPLTKDLDIIQKLDDEPNDVGGLSAQELKATFDRAGNLIKEYINETLIPQVLGDGLSEQHRQANEAVRQENEAARVEAEAAREEDCDERYLQLTGGYMTGQMCILAPQYDDSPVPKWHVRPDAISVEKLPARTTYRIGDPVQAEGMVVTAKYKDGNSLRVTGYVCDPAFVQEDTGQITVVFGQPHAAPLSAELPFLPTSEMTNYSPATLPISQTWAAPVFMDGVWVMWNAAQTNSRWTAYSEDGGKTWKSATLPVSQQWNPPVYAGGAWVLCPIGVSSTAAYSEDGGRHGKARFCLEKLHGSRLFAPAAYGS